jgi:hypothetical protein
LKRRGRLDAQWLAPDRLTGAVGQAVGQRDTRLKQGADFLIDRLCLRDIQHRQQHQPNESFHYSSCL